MAKYDSILGAVGNTPVVKINKLAPNGANLYVKVEAFNPMGSVKDRLALGVIEDAERSGKLAPGQTVIEATSGNTGIGLAMVCAQKGYPLVVTMAENFSVERRKMMRFLGAKVVLTPASEKGTGMLLKAIELAETHGWFLCRQFENEANANVHSKTTAQEILRDFKDEPLDYWVTGFGTGGTLKGVSRVLKKERPETKIVVCEPDNSAIMGSGIPQARNDDGSIAESHPSFRAHLMQGWTPDFIPKLAEDAQAAELLDIFMPIKGNDALRCSMELAQKEGIFVGISAGATLAGAIEVCARHRRTLSVDPALLRHLGRHDLRRDRDLEIDPELPLRRTTARATPRRRSRAEAGDPRGRGFPRRGPQRSGAAGSAVRLRVVRVLLVGAKDVRGVRHPLPLDRSRLGGVPGERLGRPNTGGAQRAVRCQDDPPDLCRRQTHRRCDGGLRRIQRG
jgi:cysteine synthase A